jgi:2-polyprenyl-3-methyl-5-hydroxy-6-metoxy-1,4-benzoquinol methylase
LSTLDDPHPAASTGRCALAVPNKTLAWQDLNEPVVRAALRKLRSFLWRAFTLRGTPVAVNGVRRYRWRVRPLKLWEYARGWAAAPVSRGQRLLDFGGGGTLTPFYAASLGAQVYILDLDQALTKASAETSARRGWPLQVSTLDLAAPDECWPPGWPVGEFDAIHSYCVLEHVPYAGQERVLPRLARALAPGGRMVLTFEFGAQAPGEAPWRDRDHLERMISLLQNAGLQLCEPRGFVDDGHREVLDKRHPASPFAFGMLVLEKPKSVS